MIERTFSIVSNDTGRSIIVPGDLLTSILHHAKLNVEDNPSSMFRTQHQPMATLAEEIAAHFVKELS